MAKGKVIHNQDCCTVLVEGNKNARLEPSEHIIKFPGGSIGVTRTSNNEYWAHVVVNNRQVLEESHGDSKRGFIIDTRIDHDNGIANFDNLIGASHVAVRIRTVSPNT